MNPQSAPTSIAAIRPWRKNSYWSGSDRNILRSGMRSFTDHDHAVVEQNHHVAAVGLAQNVRCKNLLRMTLRNDPAIKANDPGKMRGNPVEIMSRNDDGDPLMVNLVQKMNHIIA